MGRARLCGECLQIATEYAQALQVAAKETQEKEADFPVPFAERIETMTDADWNRMTEEFQSSRLGEARRRVVEHRILTGHWTPVMPFGYFHPFGR